MTSSPCRIAQAPQGTHAAQKQNDSSWPKAISRLRLPRPPDVTEGQLLGQRQLCAFSDESLEPQTLIRAVVLVELDGDHYFELGCFTLGSSESCAVVLGSTGVLAEHARLKVGESMVTIEQVDPNAPVLVNGRAIESFCILEDGDRLRLGQTELQIFQRDLRHSMATVRPPTPDDEETHGSALARNSGPLPKPRAPDLRLSRAADRLLALGKVVQAELLLQGALSTALWQVRHGQILPRSLFMWATKYALELARDTRRACWLDYVVELHVFSELEMSDATARAFTRLRHRMRDYDRQLLETYRRRAASEFPKNGTNRTSQTRSTEKEADDSPGPVRSQTHKA